MSAPVDAVDSGHVSIFQRSAQPDTARGPEFEDRPETQEEAQRGEFLRSAYHHIHDPIEAIVGFSELLRDRNRDFSAGVRNEVIELLAIQAQEASQIADDLLIAATLDHDHLDIDTSGVDLRGVVEQATKGWASHQMLRLTVSGNALARADARWVTHIVRNLLRNAVASGGRDIAVRITDGHHRVVLDVVDDGPGVAPELVDSLFDPYRSSTDNKSLGLGLFVCRRLARAMGGELIHTREGDKTVFELSMPKVSLQTAYWDEEPDVVIDPLQGRPSKDTITDLLDQGGPEIVYQPIYDLRAHRDGDSQPLGYESLSRFPFASPPEWFEVAGSLGMKLDLELAAIEAAIGGFSPSTHEGFLAMNLSDATLASSLLEESLRGVDPGRIILELSEVALIKSYEATKRHVDQIRDRGIRLAVDDVGAGEVDLWQIMRLDPAVLKIDMCLVRNIETNPRNRALVRGLAAMAQDLGIMVIAEGIESPEEEEQLLALGVGHGQGYMLGKPGPLEWKTRVLRDEV
jgi:EAL domain-containing protein (putative c-di-GMP-specific phosphodiesterase class I)/anti-sigma regulatory factor (Ser/Thr protein kinase)